MRWCTRRGRKVAREWLKNSLIKGRWKKEREKEREEKSLSLSLESFLQANTDLSTRCHLWKRNLIREKLNSFKCTSCSLLAPDPSISSFLALYFHLYFFIRSFAVSVISRRLFYSSF